MATYKPQTEPESFTAAGSVRFDAHDAITTALTRALPHLKCLVCGTDSFVVADSPELGLRTSLGLQGPGEALSHAYEQLVSLCCERCGYVMSFQEDRLAEFARSAPAERV